MKQRINKMEDNYKELREKWTKFSKKDEITNDEVITSIDISEEWWLNELTLQKDKIIGIVRQVGALNNDEEVEKLINIIKKSQSDFLMKVLIFKIRCIYSLMFKYIQLKKE